MLRQRRHVACQQLAVIEPAPDRARSLTFKLDHQHTSPSQSTDNVEVKTYKNNTPLAQDPDHTPDELGKSAAKLNTKLSPHEFYTLVDTTRERYELNYMKPSCHSAAPLINHMREHGAPVCLNTTLSADRLRLQIKKGAHPTAKTKHIFFRNDVLEQMKQGHLLVLPLSTVRDLPHLWVTPSACIPQNERRDRPIYNYTFSGLNDAVKPTGPVEAMQLGRTLPRILQRIDEANPELGPVFMAKTDLSDAYMRVWLNIVDVPKLAFAIPPIPSDPEPLIGFHLSLPMGYLESATYFCAVSETVADLANQQRDIEQLHPLEEMARTRPPETDPSTAGILSPQEEEELQAHFNTLSTQQLQNCIDYVDVYVPPTRHRKDAPKQYTAPLHQHRSRL